VRTAKNFDVIIAGGGTMGTAAAWALAKRGVRPLVIEQFQHFHDKGSHSGDTRVIRRAYAESPEYVPLVQRADTLWQELEQDLGEPILIRCGGIELAAPGYRHARAARTSAEEHELRYEWLRPQEVRAQWPMFHVPDDWDALYSPDTGFLLTEPAFRAMGGAARRYGATILEHTPVVSWGATEDNVWVETDAETFQAESLIVTAGAWAGSLLANLGLPLQVRRKTLWWQKVENPERFTPHRFPVFITDSGAGEIYGFPIYGTPGLKIANHKGGEPADPNSVERLTRPDENHDCLELARLLLPGMTAEVVKSAVCLYTVTPDFDFIVDRLPSNPRVAIGAGFSGHGFKFAPAIGELLADVVTTDAALPERLRMSRFEQARIASGSWD
jgi:monomeric sarcosine oxidase